MTDRLALPPSQMNVEVWDSEVRGLHQANAAYYTAEQVHAYALAERLAERARCIAICGQVNREHGEHPEMALTCSAAIRARP